ncbi:AMP-binding enzyme domain-containing protein [Cladophialophora immunda]|nr:AMP-binding enzyme domain-containing protein [Cladophialophora immunda]
MAAALTFISSISPAKALAVPAVLSGLAYLNARWRLPVDVHMFRSVFQAQAAFNKREKAVRINSFYVLEEHAHNSRIKDQPFIIYQGRQWTFKETYDIVLRYAGCLHLRHSIQPGEIVALDMINSPHLLFLTLAVWSVGALPAFVNYNLSGDAFIHSVRVSTARLLIIDPEVAARVLNEELTSTLDAANFRGDNVSPLTTVILTESLQSSLESECSQVFRAPDCARSGSTARSPSVLIFTSGTTGLPKAAIVPWERVVVGARIITHLIDLQSVSSKKPDRFYVSMPLYHGTAFLLGFCCCLEQASTLVLSRKFSVSKFWDELTAANATVFSYVGETLRYLVAAPPQPDDRTKHRVRLVIGNGLRPDVWERFKDRFGIETITEFYGATESVGASLNLSRNSFSSGAIGQVGLLGDLFSSKTQAIAEIDWETEEPRRDPKTGFCVKVPRGQPGELLYAVNAKDIRSKYSGYFGNKKASNSKIWRDVFQKGDAWFRSGDVIKFDREGRMWFSDRIGDTFRWRSENVSTNEVAEVLGRHPAIIEANVYGVEIPNHDGRAGCAAVLLKDVTSPDVPVSESVLESIADVARSGLPKYAVPVFLRIVVEITSTGNNKQQKHILRSEGVEPSKVSRGDRIFYLPSGSDRFEPFGGREWNELLGGRVKL